ncbi:MAG: hypothetical protein ACI837_002208 [Crocinitomicaceae bacterium]|jgi:hypothetical protein
MSTGLMQKGDSSSFYYIEQSDWLEFIDRKPEIYPRLTDQANIDSAWQINRIKVEEIVNSQDLTKAIICNNGDKVTNELPYFWSRSKNEYYDLTDNTLRISTISGNTISQILYKNKFFDIVSPVAHKRFVGDSYETFLYATDSLQNALLYTPQSTKFKKTDVHSLDFKLDDQSMYFLSAWYGKDKKDLLEMADSAFYVYPQIGESSYGSRVELFHYPFTFKDFLDENDYTRFTRSQIPIDSWTQYETADFNNDGRMDVFLDGGNPTVLLNQENGIAQGQEISTEILKNHGCSVVDADNDGDLDILINSSIGLRVFYNEKGVFSQPTPPLTRERVSFFFLTDIDEDGDKDLILNSDRGPMHYSEFENGRFKLAKIWEIAK